MQVPSDDFKCTKGLCGTFDGNNKNDLTGRSGKVWQKLGKGRTADGFSESWKLVPLSDIENLFLEIFHFAKQIFGPEARNTKARFQLILVR